ncbi:MAG TPA: GMC oxidoreductase, partial [Allosphingosinicella sp.]|nr:GMC oxidoreductase [Allosphingosinicella sp.]
YARSLAGTHFKVLATPQARNSTEGNGRPACCGNASCIPVCSIGAKYDATVHVKRAVENGAELLTQCVVREVRCAPDGRIEQLVYDRWSRDGSRESETLAAKRFVLAAHAIETPLLMLGSRLAARSPVGACLMDHLQGYGLAILPQPVYPFRGPPVTSGIDAFRDGPWRSERAAFRLSIGNDGWGREEAPSATLARLVEQGLWGRELRDAVAHRVTRMIRMSYSTEMLPRRVNRVSLAGRDAHGNSRPGIDFSLPDYNVAGFEHAKRVIAQIFARLGATETRFSFPAKNYSGAGHIMGTCRMGRSPDDSVVDSDCRVHGHPNLFIAGASLFTTSGTANPTLTAAALALRLADMLSVRREAE